MPENFYDSFSDNIFKEDLQKGRKLLELDSVQLYDHIVGLCNPIVFSSVISDAQMRLSDQELEKSLLELLEIYNGFQMMDDAEIDGDKWLQESLQLIRKAFDEAQKLLSTETKLYRDIKKAHSSLDLILGDTGSGKTKILVNVIPDEMKRDSLMEFDDGGFVSFSVDDFMKAPREVIRVPRFKVKKMGCSFYLKSGQRFHDLSIIDYSFNRVVLHILRAVQEFMIILGAGIETADAYAQYIKDYSEVLNAQTTAYIMEDELLFQAKFLDVNESKTVDLLYKSIAEHILGKLPESFLHYHEDNEYQPYKNYVTHLLGNYQQYVGGLCALCPWDLREQRNDIFTNGLDIIIGLPPKRELHRHTLLHYHFSLCLTTDERDIFLQDDDGILLLYGQIVTDKFRPIEQIGIKIIRAERYQI